MEPAAVSDLIEIQSSLAQIAGPVELQDLSRKRRRIVSRLAERARDLLKQTGHSASAQTIERISSTLLAVNTEHAQELLRVGRLERDISSAGFADLFDQRPQPKEDSEPSPALRRDVKQAEALESEARAAIREARELRETADRLRIKADEAEAQATAAERRAEEAERKAAQARAKL
ncbi:MAG TPA: hypothetical protein VE975_07335 [Actinomycetota bacterium]|nr:hypothetical protein [Actinomycetota bacterium]